MKPKHAACPPMTLGNMRELDTIRWKAMIKSIGHGKWFLTVNCAYCGETIRIAEAPSLKSDPYFSY